LGKKKKDIMKKETKASPGRTTSPRVMSGRLDGEFLKGGAMNLKRSVRKGSRSAVRDGYSVHFAQKSKRRGGDGERKSLARKRTVMEPPNPPHQQWARIKRHPEKNTTLTGKKKSPEQRKP